eukprot:CAMPEP_0174294608 /NCGR_PEP_ID=MMETSP0809-20121228/42167_1 /TAXON_ID=73025 ORGANISM="Eutreptiella gymnastica-like, Strain CCMP1594" /NCGR_SAMPLE_ID=MMETSP0809 /ASSEMBLY_ACC=CAM_ASM_000658 /LENGTH=107 /DNA_ID=CAMNT_0015396211 /DNA_START=890 /DNA_END=1210 /DNA_ORIENTATION=-
MTLHPHAIPRSDKQRAQPPAVALPQPVYTPTTGPVTNPARPRPEHRALAAGPGGGMPGWHRGAMSECVWHEREIRCRLCAPTSIVSLQLHGPSVTWRLHARWARITA